MIRRRSALLRWSLASLVVASVVAGGSALAAERVRAAGERWRPAHTYIGVGERVVWRNPTERRHDVTAYGGGWSLSRTLRPGDRASFVFDEVRDGGRPYLYRCVIHSAIVDGRCVGMCGKVHVFTG